MSGSAVLCLSICLDGHLGSIHLSALVIDAANVVMHTPTYLFTTLLSIPVRIYQEVESGDHMVILLEYFEVQPYCFLYFKDS